MPSSIHAIHGVFGWLRFRHDSEVANRLHISYAEQKLAEISWNGEPLA